MKSKNGRKVSVIVVLAVISLICIGTIDNIATAIENKKLTEQISVMSESESILDEGIADKNNDNNKNEEELLEDKAREEGYIYPDEIVYADSAN